MLKKIIINSLLFLFITVAEATPEYPVKALAQAGNATPTTIQVPMHVCPTANQLVKKDLLWEASGGWVSYGESFDKHVTKFVRAEWIGINVGKIICIYKGDKKYAFPIALEQKHNKLAPTPKDYQWSKDLGGRKECISSNVNDCPFTFEQPRKEGNIYENLDFFKGKSTDEDF